MHRQAERVLPPAPSPPAPPPAPPPPVPSPGMSPATLQHPLGTVGHIRQESGSLSGPVFSLSLLPWLRDSPAAAGAFLPLTRGRGPARVPQRPPGLQGTRDVSCIAPRTLFPGPGSSWVSCGSTAVPACVLGGLGLVPGGPGQSSEAVLRGGWAGRLSGQCQRCPRWLCPQRPGWARHPGNSCHLPRLRSA